MAPSDEIQVQIDPPSSADATPKPAPTSKRAVRAPPALREQVSRVVTLLAKITIEAITDGRSVTASKKRIVIRAAEETQKAITRYERLASPMRVNVGAPLTNATHAINSTNLANASPAALNLMCSATLASDPKDDLRQELVTCVSEVRKLRGDLATAAYKTLRAPASAAAASYALMAGRPTPAHSTTPHPTPYASRTMTSPPPPLTPSTKPALVITTKTPVTTRQEAVEAFRKSISFREAKYAPSKVSPLSNNKLRVEFDSIRDCEDALRRLRDSPTARVTAEPDRKLRPMIILKGISVDVSSDDLVNVVLGQNTELETYTHEDIKLKFKRSNHNKNLYNAVLVVSPQLFRAAVQMGRVRVDHQRVHAEEFSPFVQCHHCLQFGHVRKHCGSEQRRCAHCAEATHVDTDCPVRENPHATPKCYNCAASNVKFGNTHDTAHRATSSSCTILANMRQKILNNIDYGYTH
ncbi:jg4025 [Pararge aegeria aegeria]|uniref:Jg4025 protein n=1 Tax=Pararge aegeria aegeria TaxID=348720 RepID=A0A8S4RB42_9NEOP|nr:jg4025 [Pararge aegeria aegeria]